MTRDDLEALLSILAAQASAAGGWNDGLWTQRIKEQLIRIAHGQGYRACASKIPDNAPEECQPDWPEWLYDITWLDGHDDGAGERFTIYRVPVVAEIEWGNEGDVWDDFQKLRACKEFCVCEPYDKPLERRDVWQGRKTTGFRGSCWMS